MRSRGRTLAAWLIGVLALACDDPTLPTDEAVFEILVVAETFGVAVADPVQVDSFAARLVSGLEGNITGELRAGDGGVNTPWSWHLDPATVEAVQATVEVCDGRPSFIEDDIDYWLETVGRYCPWGAKVVARVQ